MTRAQRRASFLPAGLEASGETLGRLKEFERLLGHWNRPAGLVSGLSLEDCRVRHFQDSAQLFRFWPEDAREWMDLGSGGGFPAIVLACLGAEKRPGTRFLLVESNRRKHLFLSTAIRKLQINAEAVCARVKSLDTRRADVVSARALAPLPRLLDYACRHLAADGLCVFPKGRRFEAEIAEARKDWRFELQRKPSLTSPSSAILLISQVRPRR